MSFSAPDALSLAGLTSGLPAINPADIPSNVRTGNAKAKQAYTEGLEFEQVLVQRLAQELASTAGGTGASSASGSDNSSSADDSGSGLLGSDSPASEYSSLIPQALTSSIMSGGGLGVASEIAQAIDPSINDTRSTHS